MMPSSSLVIFIFYLSSTCFTPIRTSQIVGNAPPNRLLYHGGHDRLEYFDDIEKNIVEESEMAKQEMGRGVENLKNLTETYIEATLKRNLYTALRQLSKVRSTIPPRMRGRYPSKLLKQSFDDLLGAGDDAGPLDIVVTWTGLIFKQLLLIPNLFRDTVRKNLVGPNKAAVAPGAKGNVTSVKQKSGKDDKKPKISLAVRARRFLNTPTEIQLLGIAASILTNGDMDSLIEPASLSPVRGEQKLMQTASKPKEVKSDRILVTARRNQDLNIMGQKIGQKFLKQWRRLIATELDENFRDIFADTREAYKILNKMQSFNDPI